MAVDLGRLRASEKRFTSIYDYFTDLCSGPRGRGGRLQKLREMAPINLAGPYRTSTCGWSGLRGFYDAARDAGSLFIR